MRKSATEILRNLELRIARLEKQSVKGWELRRGDSVMLITQSEWDNGGPRMPATVEGKISEMKIEISLGMRLVVVDAKDLIKATGNIHEDLKNWEEGEKALRSRKPKKQKGYWLGD